MIFSDGRDLMGVTRVEDIKYMRYFRTLMRGLGAWPGHAFGESKGVWTIFKIFLDVNTSLLLLGEILYIWFNFNTLPFVDMGNNYITVFMTVVCFTRCLTIWNNKYNQVLRSFVKELHLFNVRNKSTYSMKIHLYVHKFSHAFAIYMMSCFVVTNSFFNLIPLINNAMAGGFRFPPPENVTYEVSVYYALPFDYLHNFKGYAPVTILNLVETYLAASYFCIIDLYMGLMMIHLWGHLKIIIYDFDNFPRPANDNIKIYGRYSNEELLDVKQKLKSIVEHYNQVLKYIKDVGETFGPAIAVSYAFFQVTLCILLFQCAEQGSKGMLRYGPMTVGLLSLLVQMSLTFELVASMRDKLINSVYGLPWEYMDTSNRKSVMIILQQVQRPLGLKAVGMVEIGCNTMVAILKTSISYFAMLRTMAVDD